MSNIDHKYLISRALISKRTQTMDGPDWEDLREEICTHLEIGKSRGEAELDTVTRLIWLERLKALDTIEHAVAAALDLERGLAIRKARVLQWKPPLRSRGPL
jgi:hypothetical protein